MTCRAILGACVALIVSHASAAQAVELPYIKIKSGNQPESCATPGRLMAMVKARNKSLDPSFEKIAMHYMRHGEKLGMRWDYAFFQMLVETNFLSFRRGNGSWGDVRPDQNNFAGLGATGGGVRGERFASVSDGVLAHLQHVMMYAGVHIDEPVADRTRKVQSWGILDKWRRGIRGDVRFSDLTRKWSPRDRIYASTIAGVAERFRSTFCNQPDPEPALLQEARGIDGKAVALASTNKSARQERRMEREAVTSQQPLLQQKTAHQAAISGAELAERAIERGKAEGDETRSGLGALQGTKSSTPFTLLNGLLGTPAEKKEESAPPAERPAPQQTAFNAPGLGKGLRPDKNAGAKAPPGCKVWTASYGGTKTVIIRAPAGATANFTVLDVNVPNEKREIEAFVAAYAKGGKVIGEFASPATALSKAFELCPEG